MVPLEVILPAAIGARHALEPRRPAQFERGSQRGGPVPAEVRDRVNVDTVVEHGLQERVAGQFPRQRNGNRSATDECDIARPARPDPAGTR